MTVSQQERQRRIGDRISAAAPDADWDKLIAEVDAELEVEAEESAEGRRWAQEISESAMAMVYPRCVIDGCNQTSSSSIDGMCPECRKENFVQAAQEAGDEVIGGRSRRELVAAHRERQRR